MKTKRQTATVLKGHKLAPKKRFGQNFLVHKHTAEAIVKAGNIDKEDIIVEVGVGLGALTLPLAESALHVYGYEIDRGLVRYHQEEGDLPANVTLFHQDILTADFREMEQLCGGKIKIMANLPYSISNPFIFKLINNASYIKSATIMLQKEVAERLLALPNSKDYGVPTVLLSCCAHVKKLMTLSPNEFHPRPKIDSVVVSIDFIDRVNDGENLLSYDFQLLKRIVKVTFNQRRKTILNTLSSAFCSVDSPVKISKETVEKAIFDSKLQPTFRPEVLTISNFIDLTNSLQRHLSRT